MYKINIRMLSSNAPPSPNWGSLMHGMLIEHLSGHWPSALHEGSARPVSQWVEALDGNRLLWHLSILDDRLAGVFLSACKPGDIWYCQHNSSRLTVEKLTIESLDIKEYMLQDVRRSAHATTTLHLKTATTHKSGGKYILFPSVELIANNLRNRLVSLDESFVLPDEHLSLLTDRTQIVQYHLQTVPFGLEGVKIEGYTGFVRLRFSGPDEIVSFGNMLFGLAEWFGVGIKTALGMGGCLVTHA